MQRRLRVLFLGIAGATLAGATAQGGQAVAAKSAPELLRAIESGQTQTRVIVGLRDGTTPARLLRAQPDSAGEPARRARRLAAQQHIASEIPSEQFRSSRFYDSFSMMAGVATPDGLESLAQRSDVAWLTLDGRRRLHQAGVQPPQSLIHSDAANALGFTGQGQTVAVLDTGVDQSVAALGGGSFPNAKVVGGTNITEPGSPPYDCAGHGTAVASIAASSLGVAPDAKIVAIKVFPGCEEFTYDSIIIAGLDFAISNQGTFGISAVNMSLGISASGEDLGFCDSLQPQFADSIDAATAAGMVVTVSSGNDASTNQISAPACVSSAVSVGAVFSLSAENVDFGVGCVNNNVQPGTPTCFSNSNSNLTLLAPGAFWSVPTAGGEIISFTGTSAAAPAVAGSVALVRSAKPGLSPSSTVSLLRATGRPIADPRNGVVTPLVDDLAAVQFAPGTFGNLDAPPIAIPDLGTATATVTVSGFTGFLATVEVWVEIDHPDPRQLRLTLTGPDGTSVILHDVSGRVERPINVIYGRTEASLFPLSAFQGKEANGTWTLTVQDLVAGVSGRILHFTVTPVAGAPPPPIEAIPLNVVGQVLPIVARTQGTHFFQTDVRLLNPNLTAKEFDLYYVGTHQTEGNFVGTGQTGATAFKISKIIGPGEILSLPDVVLSEFGQSDSFGQVTVVSDDLSSFLVASHTYTSGPLGTFGFAAPGFPTATALGLGSGTATANGLGKGPGSHTNAGFVETSGFPVTVRFDVRDGNGTLLGTTSRKAQPYTNFLITDLLLDRGIPPQTNVRVDFTVTSPTGRAVPFAATVDDATGDSAYHAGILPALTTDDIIVTQTAHILGASGNFFQTMLNITNTDTKPATFTVSLLPLVLPVSSVPARGYTLAAGQTVEFPDVLATEFNLEEPVATALRIHPLAAESLVVSARTSVKKLGGEFGYTVDGVRASKAIFAGGPSATTIFLDQDDTPSGNHTEFGFTEVAGAVANVTVTAFSGDTGAFLATNTYAVSANTTFQIGVSDLIGDAPQDNFYLVFSVTSGIGSVIPYASTVDNTSGDVTYIPAQ